jgi:hypothetical protein
MSDILSKLDGGEILGLCGIILGLIATVGGLMLGFAKVMATYYRKVQLDEMEATLKMEMIQRGMSADEVTRVLGAKMGGSKSRSLADFLVREPQPRMPNVFCKEAKKS